ncbi:hypothetical protein COC42_11755 [Sphingomonas spermidinifaciens]|uniref:DUF2189 domain-containing protein n=1 Tax=Sphingomonas spermidinifaciens TaxID=1141889 RepID=A0A2A4B240_9SPHN|nr:DUF2189 domain-containing protein [Sphingomonas spermidinifaciens]PCD02140.1 hypothetical protein COC42_11755 [Sphingomonas spermidinifaciens]
MAITMDSATHTRGVERIEVRRIGKADLDWALAEGWRDFRERRGDLMFLGLIYPAVCLMAVIVAMNDALLPLLFPAIAGLSIAGPAVAAGFYELARRREEGLESDWSHFLDPLKGRSRTPILTLTAVLFGLFLVWLAAAYAIYAFTFGAENQMRAADLFGRLFTTSAGWEMMVVGNLAGLAFAVVALVVSFVSFPMVVDKPVDAGTAIATSIAAARANPGETAGWGLRVVALLALGTIPFAVGLAVVLPWLGYATWHLYTRIVKR